MLTIIKSYLLRNSPLRNLIRILRHKFSNVSSFNMQRRNCFPSESHLQFDGIMITSRKIYANQDLKVIFRLQYYHGNAVT